MVALLGALSDNAGAQIDRIEEAVAGGMRNDGKSQLPVGRVEVFGSGSLLGGFVAAVTPDSLGDAARLRQRARRKEADAGGGQQTLLWLLDFSSSTAAAAYARLCSSDPLAACPAPVRAIPHR